MDKKTIGRFVTVCLLGAGAMVAQEAKEKPPLYTYVASFAFPRAHWGEVEKQNQMDDKVYQAALASGTLVGYGEDESLVHTAKSYTHDSFFAAKSLAALLNVLDQFSKSHATDTPVLASATSHEDKILVSRHYNWRPGSWKDIYTFGQSYKLKADAPDDAIEMVSKTMIVPLMEKLLADGTIVEYDIDTESVHKDSPDMFYVYYMAPNAESIDKARLAQREAIRSNVLFSQAFGSMTDLSVHRDDLAKTSATYK